MDDRGPRNWSPQLSLLEFAPGAESEQDREWLEGTSEAVRRLRQRATAIARAGYGAAVIAGEPGCGKHRVARWLHRHGGRGDRALATVDAGDSDAPNAVAELVTALDQHAAVPGNLLVHNVQRAGAPLLRRLLELLSRQPTPLRCGLLLLTTSSASVLRARSLEHEQLIGRSTSALLDVPSLRQRPDDVPVLARSFLGDAATHYDRPIRGLSPQALARLQRHAFPGNLRELRLVVEHAVLRGTGDWVTLDDLALPSLDAEPEAERAELVIRLPGASLREVELQTIRLALRLCDGRLVRAADLLGITRHALRRKLEKYNLDELRQRGPVTDDEPDSDTYI